ncbi:MAG: hypothetical protein EON93_11255, partial [Burkholderiales bacterium]
MKPLLLCSLIAASLLPCEYASAQGDLYRITDGSSRTVTHFHPVAIPRGTEHVLADLKGPGKVTYF